jgi:hypothetical protein
LVPDIFDPAAYTDGVLANAYLPFLKEPLFHEAIVGISVPAGFDVTGKQDDWSTWGRLGRDDKDSVQRLFDPSMRQGSLKFRFKIGIV